MKTAQTSAVRTLNGLGLAAGLVAGGALGRQSVPDDAPFGEGVARILGGAGLGALAGGGLGSALGHGADYLSARSLSKSAGILGAVASHPVATAATALTGAAAVRGAQHAGPHYDQVRGQIEAMKQDASTPVQKFAAAWQERVRQETGRYERFAARKLGEKTAGLGPGQSFGASMLGSFGEALTKSIAQHLFAAPLNKAFEIIDKKLYLEPKQKNVLQAAIQSDPVLARAMQETPEIVTSAYKTLKQFAPSMTVDPNSVKNFLRQAVVMGGQIDFATIKLLAEAEKNVRASRGQIGANL